jgi:glutathione S-transferase
MAAPAPAKLYYFRGRGNSQQARWALAAAGVPYESVCFSTAAEFAALKEAGKLTFGQVPMLDHDGRCISQSLTIVRHAARRGSLYGATDDEATRIDEVLDGIKDSRGAVVGYPFSDPQETCMRHVAAVERYFPCFEAVIARNASPPFAVGASLTMADVLLAELVESTSEMIEATFGAQANAEVLAPFPLMRTLHAHVRALPTIASFKQSENWMPFPAGDVAKAYVRNVRTVLA